LTIAELALDMAGSGQATDSGGIPTPTDLRRAALHQDAATAARFLDDAERAHAHLDEAEAALAAGIHDDAGLQVRTRVTITRAELLHYAAGDPDAALTALSGAAPPS